MKYLFIKTYLIIFERINVVPKGVKIGEHSFLRTDPVLISDN